MPAPPPEALSTGLPLPSPGVVAPGDAVEASVLVVATISLDDVVSTAAASVVDGASVVLDSVDETSVVVVETISLVVDVDESAVAVVVVAGVDDDDVAGLPPRIPDNDGIVKIPLPMGRGKLAAGPLGFVSGIGRSNTGGKSDLSDVPPCGEPNDPVLLPTPWKDPPSVELEPNSTLR